MAEVNSPRPASFALKLAGIAVLIATAFGVPLVLIAVVTGQTWTLMIGLPHLLLASAILAGIIAAVDFLDSPDDAPHDRLGG